MAFLQVKNNASSTLAADITSTATSLTVATGEGAKFPASNFHITIDDEILLCTTRTDDTFTVERAKEGTTAAVHSAGAKVELRITAAIIQELQDNKIDIPSGSTQGDILIRDATGWTRLAAGTAGQFLKTQGSGVNPVWADIPSIVEPAIVGDFILANAGSASTSSTTYVKGVEFRISRSGDYRFTWSFRTRNAGVTAYSQVWRNDSPFGNEKSTTNDGYQTVSDDVTGWQKGDLAQLYIKNSGSITDATDFTIKLGNPI